MTPWLFDEKTWLLGVPWLLLGTAVLLTGYKVQGTWDKGQIAAVIALIVVGFLPLVAGSFAGLIATWLLLAIAWGVTWVFSGGETAQVWSKLKGLLLGLPFIWLAATYAPEVGLEANWPTAGITAVLTAALLQLGVWPVHQWRPSNESFAAASVALLQAAPALAGGVLLTRLVENNSLETYNWLLTMVGLGGVLVGTYLAWGRLAFPMTGLAVAQSGLVVLAAVWAGAEAVLAETRVLVLAVGILSLSAEWPLSRARWWRAVPAALALAAIAGLPLTAGFAGRAALYSAWVENGRWLLVLVTGLLHIPLVTAVFLHVWGRESVISNQYSVISGELPEVAHPQKPGMDLGKAVPDEETADLWRELAAFIPVSGLFSISWSGHWLAWPAVLLPALIGIVLPWRWRNIANWHEAVAQAFPLHTLQTGWQQAQRLGSGLGTAVREAAFILEGEGGLLWLLVLAVVFFLAR